MIIEEALSGVLSIHSVDVEHSSDHSYPVLSPALARWHTVFSTCAQVPIDIAFWGRARLGAWFAGLNLAADLLLMADVALHFFRAYVSHNSVIVTRLAQIRRHYLGAHPCIAPAPCRTLRPIEGSSAPCTQAQLCHLLDQPI